MTGTSTTRRRATTDDGVLVALSGGVDSAVALLRLATAGGRVEAAIVTLWPSDDPRSCCGPTAIARAQAAADQCGVRLHVLDEQARFARTVVEPFVAAYLAGETPNPCVRCNPERLTALVGLADELDLARVATGHYARLVTGDGASWSPPGSGSGTTGAPSRAGREARPFLARGVDRGKDQSYMLAMVPPAILARLAFPLGDLSKAEVRGAARAAGLEAAERPESQEVCFALDGYRAFLEGRGVEPRPGPIVDAQGNELGEHDGQWRFTIGQRRGLGVSSGAPLYVVERRAATNEVVVGPAADLETTGVLVREMIDRGIGGGLRPPGSATAATTSRPGDDGSHPPGAPPSDSRPSGPLSVQLRYRSAAVPVADVTTTGAPGETLVRLAAPFAAPAPGQAAVFYRGDVVVGSGVIATANTAPGDAPAPPVGRGSHAAGV